MEFYQELLLTAVVSILLALVVGKLAALGSDADDLDRGSPADPARDRASAGGGAVRIEEKRVRFHRGAGLEEKAKPVRDVRRESVGDSRRAADVIGSDPIEPNEVVDDDGMDEEKSPEGGAARSEEARAGEPDLEKESREEKVSEVNESRLEGDSMREMLETVEIEKVEPDEGRSFWDGAEVEIVRSPEELLVEERGCEDEIGGGQKSGIVEEVGSLLHGEDEWEGIERSELEKLFGVATAYVNSAIGGKALSRLCSNVQMQLYGLLKVATEGPCYKPQPLALKVSARARWHAWQRLGNMNPEVAMEQYVSLLSHSIPGWMGEKPGGDARQDEGNDPPEEGVVGTGTPDSGSSLHSQSSSKIDRESEHRSSIEGGNSSAGPELSGQGLAKAFFLNLLSPTTVRFLSFYW